MILLSACVCETSLTAVTVNVLADLLEFVLKRACVMLLQSNALLSEMSSSSLLFYYDYFQFLAQRVELIV